MKYLNKSFNVSMPDVSQEKWDSIFPKDSPIEPVSFKKIRDDIMESIIEELRIDN
jgi:hypothetical protein